MSPERHRHEPGEDTSRCINCIADTLIGGMTPWETFCMGWYYANVNSFTLEAGLIGELMRDLRLRGIERILFLRALGMLYAGQQAIIQQRTQKEAGSNA